MINYSWGLFNAVQAARPWRTIGNEGLWRPGQCRPSRAGTQSRLLLGEWLFNLPDDELFEVAEEPWNEDMTRDLAT
jgi:hypothetical protein